MREPPHPFECPRDVAIARGVFDQHDIARPEAMPCAGGVSRKKRRSAGRSAEVARLLWSGSMGTSRRSRRALPSAAVKMRVTTMRLIMAHRTCAQSRNSVANPRNMKHPPESMQAVISTGEPAAGSRPKRASFAKVMQCDKDRFNKFFHGMPARGP